MPPKVRITNKQKRVMVDYMSTHTLFANCEFTGPLGATKHEAQWERLAQMLREHGPDKSVAAWKTTWRDLRRKARGANADARKAEVATGNVFNIPIVGDEEEMILSTIGRESSQGIGPPESGIGGDDIILPPVEYGMSPTFTCSYTAGLASYESPSPPSSPTAPNATSSFKLHLVDRRRSPVAAPSGTAVRSPMAAPSRPASGPPLAGPSRATPIRSVPGPFSRTTPLPDRTAPHATPLPRPPVSRTAPLPGPSATRKTPLPGPPGSLVRCARPARPRSRPARSDPAVFALLQKENNALLERIHTELVEANQLRREHIEVLRDQNRIIAANRTRQEDPDKTVVLDEETF